jgi:hypothetical protein
MKPPQSESGTKSRRFAAVEQQVGDQGMAQGAAEVGRGMTRPMRVMFLGVSL